VRIKKYILFLIIIPLFIACRNKYSDNPIIIRAEKLMQQSPDSAYKILTSIKNPENLSEADYAAWCLHYTHAQYKLYYDIKSDSLIKNAVEYYDASNLMEYSGLAYYLNGCIYDLKNDQKQSLYSYKKAIDKLEKSKDQNINGLAIYRVSNLFLKEEYYKESEAYINQAIKAFQKTQNFKYLAYSYRTKAEIVYRQELPIASIISIIDSCSYYATKTDDKNLINDIHAFKGKVLLQTDPFEAKINLIKAFNGLPFDRKSSASLLAYAYSKLNMPDSARFYTNYNLNNQLDNNSEFLQKVANAYVTKCEGKQDSAFKYFEEAYNLRENIYKQNIKEQLIRIDKQYDLSKKEAEKAKLEITLQKNVILIAFLSILVLTAIVILLFITNINKKRRANYIIEKQKLELEIKTKKAENDKKLNNLILNLHHKIDNTLQLKKLQSNLAKTERKEDFIADITRQSTLTDKEWKYYIEQANELFEGKIFQLKELYPSLTNSDLIVISLICLGIDLSNSILLLDYGNTNTIYIRRNRIKLHLGLDKTVDLEKWIKEYLQTNT
jgi:hypothetical protein